MFLQELSVEGVSIRAPIYPILAFAASPPHKNNGGGTHKQAGGALQLQLAVCMSVSSWGARLPRLSSEAWLLQWR